ncbi:hypothetical protein HMPREF0765_3472 [Sphingobacterium spiritivorum ATCC 33300]|uniref:Uncharacterized protein n=1 Tax=Sphingobacterium spiritivorum ATCC 33300 TaxID=525372 RepID=C2G1L6_SPHSI|nr:hypothetical protein HMPREF0765_3472 [Sphingobacterium spiritivorum ATCC 33300]
MKVKIKIKGQINIKYKELIIRRVLKNSHSSKTIWGLRLLSYYILKIF